MKQRAFEIVYEDDDLMVINKKAGILSIPDRYNSDKENMYSILSSYRGIIFPLHRLDKDTSGIMIYAKNELSHKALSDQFENRMIEKSYIAILDGMPSPAQGTIHTHIASSQHFKDRMVVVNKGKEAITSYTIIESFENFSVADIVIHTGRQHQIRVHMAYIGHPLAVDSKYGKRDKLFASDIKKKKFIHKKNKEPIPLIKRHSLHARKIKILHPTKKSDMEFEASVPKDMRAVINQLKKWSS